MYLDNDRHVFETTLRKLQTLLIIAILVAVPSGLGYLIAGDVGALLAVTVVLFVGFVLPSLPVHLMMTTLGARLLRRGSMTQLHKVVEVFTQKAGLESRPQLYIIPSSNCNAFALGNSKSSGIGITEGLIRLLTFEELCAVIGHEMGHIKNNDTTMMRAAQWIHLVSSNLLIVLVFSTVLILPWLLVTADAGLVTMLGLLYLLLFTPMLTTFLINALSRTREYDADLFSAKLTGNPELLASALMKLARIEKRNIWNTFRIEKCETSSWLSSHPDTCQRIARLRSITHSNRERSMLYDNKSVSYRLNTRPRNRVLPDYSELYVVVKL